MKIPLSGETMKFIKGTPFEECKDPSWYLYIDGSLKSRNFAGKILTDSIAEKYKDPHLRQETLLNGIFAVCCSRVQINVIMGERDGYYINRIGGMCSSLFNVIEKVNAETWPEPEERIKVFRWPNQHHWFAQVDGHPVIDAAHKRKWVTAQAAEEAAELYMAEKDKD